MLPVSECMTNTLARNSKNWSQPNDATISCQCKVRRVTTSLALTAPQHVLLHVRDLFYLPINALNVH